MTSSTHPFEQEEVMAYLDGELSANRAADVAAHLRECAECAGLAEQMRDVSTHLSNWSVEPAPASLTRNLDAARVGHPSAKVRKPSGIAAWLDGRLGPLSRRWAWAVAGTVAIALLVLVFAIRRSNSHMQTLSEARSYSDKLQSAADSKQVMAPAPSADATQMAAALYRERAQLSENLEVNPEASQAAQPAPQQTQPMIARTASVSLIVKDFAPLEASVKAIAQRHSGYIASLNSSSPQEAARSLTASLRIPSAQLESAIAELKQLGHVEQESQSGEEVTKEFTDRAARMKNARATEERLLDVLRNHTGQVKDILATEQEIARVRGDIEQMEADQRSLQTRVDFATVELSVQEEYKASLQGAPTATATRLHNAAVDGYRAAIDSVIGVGVWALQALPIILLWAIAAFLPARWFWRRRRRAAASQS
jgi:Domain of unknown function (DUF4349)/Putative zinc-finger